MKIYIKFNFVYLVILGKKNFVFKRIHKIKQKLRKHKKINYNFKKFYMKKSFVKSLKKNNFLHCKKISVKGLEKKIFISKDFLYQNFYHKKLFNFIKKV